MRPPSVSGAQTIHTDIVDVETNDHGLASSSTHESTSPASHPSIPHDDTLMTFDDEWPSTHALQDPSDEEKEVDNGSEDQPHETEAGPAMAEENSSDEGLGMIHIDDIISGPEHAVVDADMDPNTSILQDDSYNHQPFEPGVAEHVAMAASLAMIATPHPAFASMIQPLHPGSAADPLPGAHNDTFLQLQQQIQDAEEALNDEELNSNHPMVFGNPNPMSLGPENPGVVDFLRHWIWQNQRNLSRWTRRVPCPQQVRALAIRPPRRVKYDELKGDEYDFQGINWAALGVSRRGARNRRLHSYCNYVNKKDSDLWLETFPDRLLPTTENYFRFRRMDVRNDVRLLHFQLRNIFGCASRLRAFYPGYGAVQELNLVTGKNKVAMTFDSDTEAQISTLTASEDVLLVGGFYGDYRYRYLDSQDPEPTEGRLTDNISGITNHVQLYASRHSSSPLAAFASNDFGFRTVDLTANQITTEFMYDYAMNCSAMSPDGRLRVLVGDSEDVLITDAEKGDVLQRLGGHRDFGFACDWAPDGWTVATGNQDKTIRLWDARKWRNSWGHSNPITVIRTEMSGTRSLRFSPLGSGKRVLVAAEEADYIHAIDAQTLDTKQTLEIFGELGGISFANDGQDLMVLSCDHHRGGVLQLERCDAGAEDVFDYGSRGYRDPEDWWQTPGYDWMRTPEQIAELPEAQQTLTHRRRKAALMEMLDDPF